ncbi:unnamed protein product [Caenorhabditis angaria]|uniref:Uncharacterized protein n=1 Tax=Caenorhabditis angaria TaxID=860376 RepID=A0A9P1IZ92_9PELO|nr:unnamed protein product [Caenorhabditis angaria]
MENLERTLNNITIDDGPWRQHDQTQPVWGNGGVQPGRVWGHVPVQFQARSPWQEQPEIVPEAGMNEALGLSSGASSQWGGPSDFDKQIWSDPLNEQQAYPPHGISGGMNGLGGAPEWSTGGSQPPVWSDGSMNKESDQFWKQQQQSQTHWGAPPMGGGWPPRGLNHPNGPPPPQTPDFSGGWSNGSRQKQQPMNMSWNNEQNRGGPMGMNSRGGLGGRPQQQPPHNQGRYPGGMAGVDVSVPPPMDMGGPMGGMRQMGGPMGGGGQMWNKSAGNAGGQGAQSGGRHQYQQRGGMNHGNQGGGGNMWNGGNQGDNFNYAFPSTDPSPDDFTLTVWHDPNGELKKWQRDTGVSLWGDPEEQDNRKIRYWTVPEGEEEDLETALARCPVPQKKVGKIDADGTRVPFPVANRRFVIVTGWGDLPENDPNNPQKNDENSPWPDLPTAENPWYQPNRANAQFNSDLTGSWVQGGTISLDEPPLSESYTQLALAEMLKYAVDQGYLDISVTMSQNLPPSILKNVNALLLKIPALESVESELKQLVDSVRPAGEEDKQNPQRFMNDVQKVEHNRLIINVTTAKIEVQDLSKKIQRALIEAGIINPQDRNVATKSEDYHYSFLE